MPQLERPIVAAGDDGRYGGGVEVRAVRGVDAAGDLLGGEVVEEVAEDEARAVLIGAGEQALERRRALGDVIANEQASVWGDTLENCLLTC